ncbi:NifB/NifX family molybdenum-iron cluster-binding protein [Desulfogranum marinum]|uniref:NifB/NifX family molybdenum-iron cluster-binding protein n=1 Tax=Desulfogranum marinum TaxID=453220 RepID=UPI0029C61E6D|nr:NifB/NifX family molybdenum-iron cluster-binding protein [Desulfogranum marinum]
MSVLSMTAYKNNQTHEKSYFGNMVINLPVAPVEVSRTKFASSGQVRSNCMLPHESLAWVAEQADSFEGKGFIISIAGPGDPLATPKETLETIGIIRQKYPEARFALRTLGMGGETYAQTLAEAGVEYVELVMDAVTVDTLEKIYMWIRPARKTLPMAKAAPIVFEEQRRAAAAFKQHNMTVCGSITLYPECNLDQVIPVCEVLKELGADAVAVHSAKEESDDAGVVSSIGDETIASLVLHAAELLPVINSLLVYQPEDGVGNGLPSCGNDYPSATKERPNVAVASSNGMDVDLHLGHATRILIYGPRGTDALPCLLETREAPEPGGGKGRWQSLSNVLGDCFVLLAASAGESPRKILGENGLRVMMVEDAIEGCVDVLYGGGKKGKCKK